MLFLADENFPFAAVCALQAAGHDVAWIRTEAPGSSDEAVLARAEAERRVLVTFDKDFGLLAFNRRLPATVGIVLFRIRKCSALELAEAIAAAIAARSDWPGHYSVVELHRIRMRLL